MKPNQATTDLITIHVKAVRTFEDCKAYAEKRCISVGNYVRGELAALRMEQPICELAYAPCLCEYDNPYDEIYNIIAQFSNVARAGWFFFFEMERLSRELAELKGRRVEAVECQEVK